MHHLVGGPGRASYMSLACEDEKKFLVFEMHSCLWPGAQILFRHKWERLVAAFLLLECFDWYSCLRYWNEFFAALFQVLDWSFLVLHFDWNVCNWIPKVIWPRMDWFWGFLLENGFFRWLHICIDWNFSRGAQLFFFDDINCYETNSRSRYREVRSFSLAVGLVVRELTVGVRSTGEANCFHWKNYRIIRLMLRHDTQKKNF